ncbi:MAG: pentapeptide repeat-containing protein [Hyphomicrobium sp.]|nr:pentapeptide repeat-containing protein [Hyphomicrobium sp.]
MRALRSDRRGIRLAAIAAGVAMFWIAPLSAADFTARQVTETFYKATTGAPPDFSGRDLSFLDLAGLDFKGAMLSGANLYGSDLTKANLKGSNLSGVMLDRAAIVSADFSGANLEGASLLRRALTSRSTAIRGMRQNLQMPICAASALRQ